MSVLVRAAEPEDADAIARVQQRGWQVGYRDVFPPAALATYPTGAGRWRSRLAEPSASVSIFVAGDDEVAGFIAVGEAREADGVGEVYALYVEPDRWGAGLGRALLEEGVDALRADGFGLALLWVLEENPRARRFYEAAGWTLDGARKLQTHLDVEVAEVRYTRSLA